MRIQSYLFTTLLVRFAHRDEQSDLLFVGLFRVGIQ